MKIPPELIIEAEAVASKLIDSTLSKFCGSNSIAEAELNQAAQRLSLDAASQPGIGGSRFPFGIPERSARNSELEKLLADGEFTYSPRRRTPRHSQQRSDMQTGYVEDEAGRPIQSILRNFNEWRKDSELAVYNIHTMSPFTTTFPVTASRADGRMIQQAIGRSLQDRADMLDKRLFGEKPGWNFLTGTKSYQHIFETNADFRDQLEQVIASRQAFGIPDLHEGNVGVSMQMRKPLLANLDVQNAFGDSVEPQVPILPYFAGRKISAPTLSKLETLLTTFDTDVARSFMKDQGLTRPQTDSILYRSEYFVEHGHFKNYPKDSVFFNKNP